MVAPRGDFVSSFAVMDGDATHRESRVIKIGTTGFRRFNARF